MFTKVFVLICIATAILQDFSAARRPHSREDYDYDSREYYDDDYDYWGRSTHCVSNDDSNWNEAHIDNEYDFYKLPKLAFALNNIYKDDLVSYKKMVRLQMYLYKLFTDKNDDNADYAFDVAYYFSKIKNNNFYKKLSSATQTTLDEYVDYLPDSAKALFFDDTFCLMNRKYDAEYLYASNTKIDNKRNYVFVSTKDDFNQKAKSEWKTTAVDASTSRETKLKFTLKNVQTNHFAYVERNSYNGKRNLVATWNDSAKPANVDWNVKLYQDQLIFSQNGRVICASDTLKSDSRRYVYGVDENGEADVACQWLALECPA